MLNTKKISLFMLSIVIMLCIGLHYVFVASVSYWKMHLKALGNKPKNFKELFV